MGVGVLCALALVTGWLGRGEDEAVVGALGALLATLAVDLGTIALGVGGPALGLTAWAAPFAVLRSAPDALDRRVAASIAIGCAVGVAWVERGVSLELALGAALGALFASLARRATAGTWRAAAGARRRVARRDGSTP